MDEPDVRRSDLRGVPRTGVVISYEEDAGCGRIAADDGEVLFVHFTGIVGDGYCLLQAGQRVAFVWRGGIHDDGSHRADAVAPIP